MIRHRLNNDSSSSAFVPALGSLTEDSTLAFTTGNVTNLRRCGDGASRGLGTAVATSHGTSHVRVSPQITKSKLLLAGLGAYSLDPSAAG